MKKQILRTIPAFLLFVFLSQGQIVRADTEKYTWQNFSDTFEFYDETKWATVLLYSKSQGIVSVKDEKLVLEAPNYEPCEIEIYALFTFEGDFDIQSDYSIQYTPGEEKCRFNAGIVMQTLGDETSYKTYAAVNPGKKPFSRTRVDLEGENNIEKYKGAFIDQDGSFRIVKENNIISSYKKDEGKWRLIYQFKKPSLEKLRMRFKLQTGDSQGPENEACPTIITFDNFKINSSSSPKSTA
ncbi:hypothetical protein [Desulfobacula sp.]|uniref:hypothetical protein n=1 Tax=Desulfobacula sp. TaxID=2593537 RepID=UPI00260301C3|nr:hypothetical protein [Desulfobacula sp.]